MGLDIKMLTDDRFIGTGLSASSNGCDAIYFYAYSDSGLVTTFSDPSVALTTAESVSPGASLVTIQYLNIDTSAALTRTLYLEGKNTGQESNAIELNLVVCSALTLTPGFSFTKDLLQLPGTLEIISAASYLQEVLADCPIEILELVKSPTTNA